MSAVGVGERLAVVAHLGIGDLPADMSGRDHHFYALTERGYGLREPVEALLRWSTPLMATGPQDDEFRPRWLLLGLRALLVDRPAPSATAIVAVTVDGTTMTIERGPDATRIARADPDGCTTTITATPATVLGLAAGALTPEQAINAATSFHGDPETLAAAFDRSLEAR